MMLQTVEGRFRGGKIELAEFPAEIRDARVIVTFLPGDDADDQELQRRNAVDRFIAGMKEGLDFGGKFNREELYEERLQTIEQRLH